MGAGVESDSPDRLTQYDDSRVTNGAGQVTIVKLGDDERRALKWMLPIAVFVGFNLFATLFLAVMYVDDKHSNAMWMSLVYSQYDAAKAKLDAMGIHVEKLPPPPQ